MVVMFVAVCRRALTVKGWEWWWGPSPFSFILLVPLLLPTLAVRASPKSSIDGYCRTTHEVTLEVKQDMEDVLLHCPGRWMLASVWHMTKVMTTESPLGSGELRLQEVAMGVEMCERGGWK
jgi:hypothetical protein